VVLVVNGFELRDDSRLCQIGSEPAQVENRFEVRAPDERQRLLGALGLGSLASVRKLPLHAGDLCPGKQWKTHAACRVRQKRMDAIVLDRLHQQKRVVRAD